MALAPKEGNFHNTLALAEYRAGHWAESVGAAERSMASLKGVDASNWFFLAMALWQRGEKHRSRAYFDRAIAWTRKKIRRMPSCSRSRARPPRCWAGPARSAAPLPDLPADVFAR